MAVAKAALSLVYSRSAGISSRNVRRPGELTRAALDRMPPWTESCTLTSSYGGQCFGRCATAQAVILRGNWRGPMHGIPVVVKDELVLKVCRRESVSTPREWDATPVRKLREPGPSRWAS